MTFELLPHQRTAIDKMHNGCVLWGGVGTGKTITALSYAKEKEPGKKIVVVTTAKKRDSGDWEHEAAKLHIWLENIEVTSWNKIGEYIDRKDHMFILDEQRLVGAGSWVKAFYKIAKNNRWILLSATPGDTWSDYAPMFIANGWYKNITEFRREHAVYSTWTKYPKIERWLNEGKLQKFRKALLVEMPMMRHTTRHLHYIKCDFDEETLETVRKKRWNVYEDKPLKNAAELFGVMRKVVSKDPDRSMKMAELIRNHPRLIVFYNFNYELEMLREICETRSLEVQKSLLLRTTGASTDPNPASLTFQGTSSGLILPSSAPLTESDSYSSLKPPMATRPTTSPDQDLTEQASILRGSEEFQATLPPWYLTEEEEEAAFQTWMQTRITNKEASEVWESTTSTISPIPTSSPSRASEERSPSRSRHTSIDVSTPARVRSEHELPSTRSRSSESSRTTRTVPTSSTSPASDLDFGESFGWAEWNGHKHQPIPSTDSWVYLVQYASGSEGWNCIETDSMAFWSPTYSWKQWNQAQGRIDRMNTPYVDLNYYAFTTDSHAEKPVFKSLEQKKDFQPR